jgi:hypothetical protein
MQPDTVLILLSEDPAEFFTMIFGGDAFVDWFVSRSMPWAP